MSKVLALGGAGFIGSYVVRELLRHEFEVTVVDNFQKYGYIRHDFYDHPKFKLVNKDVRQMYPIEYQGYDVVVCLAALIGGIRYFHKIPYRIARDNTEIVTSAIDATLVASPKATFVYFSSSMVYERVQRSVTEEDAVSQPCPRTNYGMQKLFGEYITRGAHDEMGLEYLILRPFNAVGGGELPSLTGGAVEFGMAHVIPDFIYKAMLKQSPFEIFGDGEQVRTFTHAADTAEALRLMLQRGTKNDDFNICGNITLPMNELARKIWARVNPNTPFPGFKHLPVPEDDVRYRVGISEKAKRQLGWTPKYELDYVIDDSIRFIRDKLGKGTH